MKLLAISAMLCGLLPAGLMAQSHSFQTLRHQFNGMEEVHSFSVGGFLVRVALAFVDDEEFNSDAIERIGKIHLITIPRDRFEEKKLTLKGYEQYVLAKDGFESLVSVQENRDNVRVFVQSRPHRDNRYLFLINDENEVLAAEFTGYVNPDKLFTGNHKLTRQEL